MGYKCHGIIFNHIILNDLPQFLVVFACPIFKEPGNEHYVARGKNKLADKIVPGT